MLKNLRKNLEEYSKEKKLRGKTRIWTKDLQLVIGTIGGALGLFLGFSFLNCIKDIFDSYPNSFLWIKTSTDKKIANW